MDRPDPALPPGPTAYRLACAGVTLDPSVMAARVSGIERQHADPSVRVQDDFFRHANGMWLEHTPMPADRSVIGAFMTLADDTCEKVRALIEQAAASDGDAGERQIGDLYASFMDEATVAQRGLQPLAAELARIDAIADARGLAVQMAHFNRLGVAGALQVTVSQDHRQSTRHVPYLSQGGLGLPDRDYYLQLDDARFADVRARYRDHLQRLLALAGVADIDHAADAIVRLEAELARVQWPVVDNRDPVKRYNRFNVDALPGLAAGFDWAAFLAESGLAGRTADVVVNQPSFVAGLAGLLHSVPLADWKAWATSRLLCTYAPLLSAPFVDERFDFADAVLRGTPANLPRWERGVALVDELLGEAVGRLYVARHFPADHKTRMEALVGHLMAAYRDSIDHLEWMSSDTKREARRKLDAFGLKIGHPSRWIDHGSVQIRPDDLVGNVMRARAFHVERRLAKLGQPVDRDEWSIHPQTVNAYYDPSLNEIVFPAAILQPPFFNMAADDAVNFGAIGAVIGHEISHGFDDQGSRFDAHGNLRDWWTPQDRERFTRKAQALVDQYSGFEPVPGYRLNGRQTLGENIADNCGLAVAHKAWQRSLRGRPAPVIDGLTGDQRFFFGWAQVWRFKWREERLIEQVKSGVHAPGEFRANGAVRNHDGFHQAFGTRPGDAMYLPPEERVAIW